MKFADLSIQRKLMLILLFTSGTVLVLISATFLAYEWFTFQRAVISETSTIARIIADNSTASLAFRNEADARRILFALRSHASIQSAALYTADNRIFATYPENSSIDMFPSEPGPTGYLFREQSLIVVQPVVEAGKRQGTLYVRADLAIQDRFILLGGIALVVFGASLLLAFLLSAVLQDRISHPILALADTARHVSHLKDYSVRAERTSSDEIGLLTDAFNHMLTQIEQRDLALRESEERLNLALRSSGVGTWSWEVPENRVVWDTYTFSLFGLAPLNTEIQYETFLSSIQPEDREAVKNKIGQALNNLSYFDVEYRVVWPDGSVHNLVSRGRAYGGPDGRAVRVAGVVYDVTDRKKAEEALRQTAEELARSNAELEQFAYVASHDLQEPLRAVAGCAQLIEKRYAHKLDADGDELIRHTVDASKRMQTLIQDLLSYSRAGKYTRRWELQDTNEILKNVLVDLRNVINRTNAMIQAENLPAVSMDPTQLSQIFQNLIGNAIKFTKDKRPEIHIGAERKRTEWVFHVRDNGLGIESQYKDRIFLLFQRLHTRREYPGTGIGLAVCKKIVEQRGGKIWVESNPGEGSTFFFTIPDVEKI